MGWSSHQNNGTTDLVCLYLRMVSREASLIVVYLRNTKQGGVIYILLYVDYMLITCKNIEEIRKLEISKQMCAIYKNREFYNQYWGIC